MIKKRYRWAAALTMLGLSALVAFPVSGRVIDMAGHWAAPLVAALEARGIVAGDAQGRFNPDVPLTRAEMAKLFTAGLGNGAEAALLAKYDSRFQDIPGWHWAKGYIESMAESGLTQGYPDGRFGPNDPVTRAQMAAFLVRAANYTGELRGLESTHTTYEDDSAIPEWARGPVQVATLKGLMAGFEDGTFRPNQPITRAEGSVALLRLLGLKGEAFHLSGTLVRFSVNTMEGTVRDELGQERTFTMVNSATFYRAGVQVGPYQVRVLDQVWIVLDDDGKGRFLDARYADLLAKAPVVEGQSLTVRAAGDVQRRYTLQAGVLAYLNGRTVQPAQINGAAQVYLALDRVTGEVRAMDAVNAPVQGALVGVDVALGRVFADLPEGLKELRLAQNAIIFKDGNRVTLADLKSDDHLQMALDDTGSITYLQVER